MERYEMSEERLRDQIRDRHIENSLITTYEGDNLLSNVVLEHDSLPELDFAEIDTEVEFLGKKISFPLIIGAITGGTEQGVEINEDLYMIAKELRLPMEIGSQDMLENDKDSLELFLGEDSRKQVRDVPIISNVSASMPLEVAKASIDSVNADALALHVNPAQEIFIKEGRRDFRGVVENVGHIVENCGRPVLVKEVGFGMSEATVEKLLKAGAKCVDISGFGGTNFVEIENLRNYENDFSDLYGWGIPTAKAILNAVKFKDDYDFTLIASGGIKTALDLVKALVLGADMVSISGEILKYYLMGGYENTRSFLEDLIYKTRIVMFLLGARNIEELKKVPYSLTGRLRELTKGNDAK